MSSMILAKCWFSTALVMDQCHVMASLAEMERELTVGRTHDGLEVARQLGHKDGYKPKMTDSKMSRSRGCWLAPATEDVAKNFEVSTLTCYRRVSASGRA